MGTKRKAEQEPVAEQQNDDDLDSSSSGLTEPSDSETSSDSGSSGSYPSESAADSDAEEADGETVTVDFEFFDPQEIDFHGLKALLQTYLDGEAYSCSELVGAIIQQVSRLFIAAGPSRVGTFTACCCVSRERSTNPAA